MISTIIPLGIQIKGSQMSMFCIADVVTLVSELFFILVLAKQKN